MGANIDTRIYHIDDKKRIISLWDEAVSHSQSMDGCSYSGCIGMLSDTINFISKVFNSVEDAEDYISENHRKWDSDPLGVPFRIQGDKRTPTYVKNAEKKCNEANEKIQTLTKEFSILNSKSLFITCKSCKSRFNKKYLNNSVCPLCCTTLLSYTNIKRIELAKEKEKKARMHLQEMRDKATKANCTGKIGYVIGGICPS